MGVDMKRVLEVLNANRRGFHPGFELTDSDARRLGFQPALLAIATMRIHSRGTPGSPGPMTRGVIAGFERGGFFYTHRSAVRACREWGLGARAAKLRGSSRGQ